MNCEIFCKFNTLTQKLDTLTMRWIRQALWRPDLLLKLPKFRAQPAHKSMPASKVLPKKLLFINTRLFSYGRFYLRFHDRLLLQLGADFGLFRLHPAACRLLGAHDEHFHGQRRRRRGEIDGRMRPNRHRGHSQHSNRRQSGARRHLCSKIWWNHAKSSSKKRYWGSICASLRNFIRGSRIWLDT